MPENGFKRDFFLYRSHFISLIKLSLLFVLFSLPVITIFASLTAMMFVTSKMVNDRLIFVWKDFWQSFRANFIRSTVYGLIVTVCAVIIYFCWNVSTQISIPDLMRGILLVVYILTTCCLLIHAAFFFHVQAWIDLPFHQQIKNCFLMIMVGKWRTLVVLLILSGWFLFIFLFHPISYMVLIFFSSSICYVITAIVMPLFNQHLIAHSE